MLALVVLAFHLDQMGHSNIQDACAQLVSNTDGGGSMFCARLSRHLLSSHVCCSLMDVEPHFVYDFRASFSARV